MQPNDEEKSGQIKNVNVCPSQWVFFIRRNQNHIVADKSCESEGLVKKKKFLRKTEWGDDSGSPPWSSIHPSLHLDWVYVDSLIRTAPPPANPVSTVGPSPRAAGASCSTEKVKLPGTKVRRHTSLTPFAALEGVLRTIWTEFSLDYSS